MTIITPTSYTRKSSALGSVLWVTIAVILALSFGSGFVVPIKGQEVANPIILKYADSLLVNELPEGQIRELMGNVHLVQGKVVLYCDRAIHYMVENKVDLLGSVRILQGSLTLSAPRIVYYGTNGLAEGEQGVRIVDSATTLFAIRGRYSTQSLVAEFYDSVHIEDDSTIIDANYVRYSRVDKQSLALGNVLLQGKSNAMFIECDSAVNIPLLNTSIASGSPVLFQVDTLPPRRSSMDSADIRPDSLADAKSILDTVVIASRRMDLYRGSKQRLVASDSVRIFRSGLQATADTSFYEQYTDLIRLVGTPRVWYDSTLLRSDSIHVFVPQKRLSRIYAWANSFASSRSDTVNVRRINQLQGFSIDVLVNQDTVQEIRARGEAKSLYFLGEPGLSDGLARNSADSIHIVMQNNKPENIYWLGGINGEYFPELFVIGKEDTYSLRPDVWLDARPAKIRPRLRTSTGPLTGRPAPGQSSP